MDDGPVVLLRATVDAAVQPILSVTVTLYDPAITFERVDAVAALLHAYVNGAVPLVNAVFTEPFALPHVDDTVDNETWSESDDDTDAAALTVQPSAVVTVTL
jgi:hypothetical protein